MYKHGRKHFLVSGTDQSVMLLLEIVTLCRELRTKPINVGMSVGQI
jgi:hypothetical protein